MRRLWIFALILVGLILPVPTAAQEANWTVEYYDNRFLIGTPVKQTSNAVSYDWESDAPVAGIGADNFSVRFSTRTQFDAGTYRFFAQADDEVRVTVDFQVIIDTLDSPRPGDLLSSDIYLSPGEHQIQVDYRENTGDAYVFVTWQNAIGNPTVPDFRPVTETTAQPLQIDSWLTQYYGNDALANFPTAILTEREITQDWGNGSPLASLPADNFSARWSAVTPLQAGRYRITARADDGIRVFADGEQILDRWNGPVGQVFTVDRVFDDGEHTFVVEYREERGQAYIEFELARLNETQATPGPVATQPGAGSPVTTNATGTVDAYRLNVRAAPTTGADIVVKVEDGETYPIVGRNVDDSWWQIDVDGAVGWVFGDFIVPVNTSNVPVTSQSTSSQQVTTTNLDLTATGTVRLRSRPSRRGAVLGLLPFGAQADIVGRNTSSTWVQVSYNGNVGWVSASYVNLPVDIDALPLGVE